MDEANELSVELGDDRELFLTNLSHPVRPDRQAVSGDVAV
jgi:hypothetical protein